MSTAPPTRPDSTGTPTAARPILSRPVPTLLDALVASDDAVVLSFAGQGGAWLPGLRDVVATWPDLRARVEVAAKALAGVAAHPDVAAEGFYPDGVDLVRWLDDEDAASRVDLATSTVSQPCIALAQILRWEALRREGLDALIERGRVWFTGHSQGLVTAMVVASSPGGVVSDERIADLVRWMAWQGVTMDGTWREVDPSPDLPTMVSIAGVEHQRLDALVADFLRRRPTAQVGIALHNTPTRHVLAGAGRDLDAFVRYVEQVAAREAAARKARRFAGRPLAPIFEPLPTSAPFHTAAMQPARERMQVVADSLGRPWDDARVIGRVVRCDEARVMRADDDATACVLASQYDQPTRWRQTIAHCVDALDAAWILDIGPGDGVARLTRSAARGSGAGVLALDTASGRTALLTPGAAPSRPQPWASFAPRALALPDGRAVLANRYTDRTGHSPVVLPGMTPTTVEVPIVAAAANAGFTAELAGGGQVTADILRTRLAELQGAIAPGTGVVFNALYLDRYLWDLHFGREGVVLDARRSGAPLIGVTISAGIPDVDEAVDWLDRFAEAGLWLNAFKPGTVDQIRQVLKIADAAPQHTVFVHVEGGTAGGHHSWESLDELLLATYGAIRERDNVVLCVGGGIATPEHAAERLLGTWSQRYGRRSMPVDAVLLGTATMAAREAATSASVKQALVDAKGHDGAVFAGAFEGGVTSGRSSLDADIHYLDTSAARAARLLDAVAGDANAVAARHDEIVEALAATCKPWIGDVATMTPLELVRRLVARMAIGRGGPYEDGAWLDVSWRQRVFDVVQRLEARMVSQNAGAFEPVVATLADLDATDTLVDRLAAAYPHADDGEVGPLDAAWFVETVCRRPGKPVPFVPVIDADVRRWFASDSLWYAHDDRFDADQVLIIPGPRAVAGIDRVDEPIAALLARYEAAAVAAIPAAARDAADRRRCARGSAASTTAPTHLEADAHTDAGAWFAELASGRGPVAAAFAAPDAHLGGRLVANPLHGLCAPVPGTVADLTRDDAGVTTAIVVRPDDEDGHVEVCLDGDGVRVTVALDADGLRADRVARWAVSFDAGLVRIHDADGDDRDATRRLYADVLFGGALDPVGLFETAHATAVVDRARERSWRAVTGGHPGGDATASRAFALAWPALFRVLAADALAEGLLRLVHERNAVDIDAAWPPRAGETVQVEARVVQVDDGPRGRRVVAIARLRSDRGLLARLESSFFIRGDYGATAMASQVRQTVRPRLALDADTAAWWAAQPWCEADAAALTGTVDATLDLRSDVPRDGAAVHTARGTLVADGATVATIDARFDGGDTHPMRALLDTLTAAAEVTPGPGRTLATLAVTAPRSMAAFANAGGDHNPIHRSPLAARLADLDAPIVHGMWTAARAEALTVATVCGGDARRLRRFDAAFLAPLALGADVRIDVVRRGLRAGDLHLEVVATDVASGAAVLRAHADVAAPRTAWIFPGQGIQHAGMGMDGYARSRAARSVWDRADAWTRASHGFSILRIVRENPKRLVVGRHRLAHPKGVLHLTQFTQVAMAVLASAQVAELREAGAFAADAVCCGHSVGEYNALAAVADVLPLEAVVDLVYHRGLTMHTLVPRDAEGRSNYRMGVVRPHYAGLDHAGAEALVREVAAATGEFIEIVNYNVRGRQYSVTGTIAGCEALAEALDARRRPGGKPAWIEVPGVDVPFHSTLLRDGVDAFRRTLDERLPATIPWQRLVGRYVPNLVPRPFTLAASFAREIVEVTGSAPLTAALDAGWGAMSLDDRARLLLIELLAWQFASPVRWIETQDVVLAPTDPRDVAGLAPDADPLAGLGVQRIVEVGVGTQPTLANMARYTLSLTGRDDVVVRNVEADAEVVFARDEDPEPVEVAPEADAAATDAGTATAVPTNTAATNATPVAVAAPAPVATAASIVTDAPLSVTTALRALLAVQARVRLDQIGDTDSIDELFDGVSSRRNQALMDLGVEFGVGSIDNAHEMPLATLEAELERRAPRYAAAGKVLSAARDAALQRVFGGARLRRADLADHMASTWGLPAGRTESALLNLALDVRDGDSARGGALGAAADVPSSRDAALGVVDAAVQRWAATQGITVAKASAATGGGAVDAAVVDALRDEITGPDGVLTRVAEAFDAALGRSVAGPGLPTSDAALQRLATLDAELGTDFADWLTPRFSAAMHVELSQPWAFARRDVARLFFAALTEFDADAVDAELGRLAAFAADPTVADTAAWYASRARALGATRLAGALASLADTAVEPVPVRPMRPTVQTLAGGGAACVEVPDPEAHDTASFAQALLDDPRCRAFADPALEATWASVLTDAGDAPLDLRDEVAVVTGASPGSIAFEAVRNLLRGGATVIVTTTSCTPERVDTMRALYREAAVPGAVLHIVPMNQGSMRDVDAFVDWLFDEATEQAGAGVRVRKLATPPTLLLPFGAVRDLGPLTEMGPWSEFALRAMLTGVERLVARIAERSMADGVGDRPCHVVLPLSPNHGVFGGDGAYGASKAGLDVLLNRWRSEHAAWGRATTVVGARIGWVRGTGLMKANDLVSAALEAELGLRTFGNDEMGWLIAALCDRRVRDAAATTPLLADLTAGFADADDLAGTVARVRADMTADAARVRRIAELDALVASPASATPRIEALPASVVDLPPLAVGSGEGTSDLDLDLDRTIVIVGFGEIGPWGTARTRRAAEVSADLSPAAVLELAWICGLVRFEGGRWVDAESGEVFAEHEAVERYGDEVRARSGLRFVDPSVAGYDPDQLPLMQPVWLDEDFTFAVSSEDDARAFVAEDPEHTAVAWDEAGQQWQVTRSAGTVVRVPRAARLNRTVAGLVPSGFDPERFGVPADLAGSVDRVALFNLIATADAFLSAGIAPEELYERVHPSRVGNTQGAGMGGMVSLRRMYVDHLLGNERQSDVLQESLINVTAAWVVQACVGSYGPMSHPVAACATAAVSLEEAYDKILADKADIIVAGGYDDICAEGAIGFSDMNATADTDEMLAMGIEPASMSRANDLRRRGFVEAHGGGTVLVARASTALALGLPIEGIVAQVGSFGDGVHRSIPAPGLGAVASATGGASSPLGRALRRFGLTADDIGVVYKHDTSTAANDPNENRLHDTLQTALDRTAGNPLWVVSQKTLTGHPKGGAAAWQMHGLLQTLQTGVVPGNRALQTVDPAMRAFTHMGFTDEPLTVTDGPIRAGLVTSLGFGHVSVVAMLVHPSVLLDALDDATRAAWAERATARRRRARRDHEHVLAGDRPTWQRRTERGFVAADGTDAQMREEVAALLDPTTRWSGGGWTRGQA